MRLGVIAGSLAVIGLTLGQLGSATPAEAQSRRALGIIGGVVVGGIILNELDRAQRRQRAPRQARRPAAQPGGPGPQQGLVQKPSGEGGVATASAGSGRDPFVGIAPLKTAKPSE